MQKLSLLTAGPIKDHSLSELASEYEKRLGSFAKLERSTFSSESFKDVREAPRVKEKDTEAIQTKQNTDAFRVLVTERGKELTSETLATKLEDWSEHGAREIQFILGGPLGLHESLDAQVDATLSLSQMTFTHEMAEVLLLEQLYRAFTIQKGKAYHY